MCDRSMLAGYSACVCSEPCGACLCCGRGLEDVAWLTGLRRASDSRMGSKESQTIIRPRRAELSCSTTVINGLSYPVLTGGDQRLTQIGSKRGTLGLRSWGDRQGLWQVLLPSPPHTLCLAVPPPPQPPTTCRVTLRPGAQGGFVMVCNPSRCPHGLQSVLEGCKGSATGPMLVGVSSAPGVPPGLAAA